MRCCTGTGTTLDNHNTCARHTKHSHAHRKAETTASQRLMASHLVVPSMVEVAGRPKRILGRRQDETRTVRRKNSQKTGHRPASEPEKKQTTKNHFHWFNFHSVAPLKLSDPMIRPLFSTPLQWQSHAPLPPFLFLFLLFFTSPRFILGFHCLPHHGNATQRTRTPLQWRRAGRDRGVRTKNFSLFQHYFLRFSTWLVNCLELP